MSFADHGSCALGSARRLAQTTADTAEAACNRAVGLRARLVAHPPDSVGVCCLPMATCTASGPGTPTRGHASHVRPRRTDRAAVAGVHRARRLTPWQLHGAEVPPGVRGRVSPAARSSANPSTSRATWMPGALPPQVPRAADPVRGGAQRTPPAPSPHGGPARARRVRPMPRLRARPADLRAEPSAPTPSRSRPGLRAAVADEVVRAYLIEVTALAASDQPFAVLAHLNYPLRFWPATAAMRSTPGPVIHRYPPARGRGAENRATAGC